MKNDPAADRTRRRRDVAILTALEDARTRFGERAQVRESRRGSIHHSYNLCEVGIVDDDALPMTWERRPMKVLGSGDTWKAAFADAEARSSRGDYLPRVDFASASRRELYLMGARGIPSLRSMRLNADGREPDGGDS